MTVNPSGWRPSTPANEQGDQQTVTGNRALMMEEPLIFEMGGDDATGVDFDQILPGTGRGNSEAGGEDFWPVSNAPQLSAFPVSANPKWSVTTPACRGRITRSTSVSSRSAHAR